MATSSYTLQHLWQCLARHVRSNYGAAEWAYETALQAASDATLTGLHLLMYAEHEARHNSAIDVVAIEQELQAAYGARWLHDVCALKTLRAACTNTSWATMADTQELAYRRIRPILDELTLAQHSSSTRPVSRFAYPWQPY